MKNIKKVLTIIIAVFIFTGCGLNSGNQVGDSGLTVSLVSVPTQFDDMDSSLKKGYYIMVIVENIVTEKNYTIILDEKNNYCYTAHLNPGNYIVKNVFQSEGSYTGIELKTDATEFELSTTTTYQLGVQIANINEFIALENSIKLGSVMSSYDMFSRKIMIGGEVFEMENLMSVLELTGTEKNVKPYSQENLTDGKRGITLTVLNDTADEKSASQCRVIAVKIEKRTAILPGGVVVGLSGDLVISSDGIYGTPHMLSGMAYIGHGIGNTECIYGDSQSGDRLTVSIDDMGKYISSLKYEFECY